MPEFAWPWVFALLPLPWLLRRLLPDAQRDEPALQVSALDELAPPTEPRRTPLLGPPVRQLPYLLIWLLLVIAAARPQWLGESLPVPSSGRDLLLAVDVSGSMEQFDMRHAERSISRLQLVQALFGPFIEQRQGDRIGLILFGSRPYLQAPLTFDRSTVHTWLRQAQVGIAGSQTALGDAIGLAIKRLRQRPANSRVLILVTDGANTAGYLPPLTAARLAAAEGIRLYTIGIGASPDDLEQLGPDQLIQGLDLDEPLLREIADIGRGAYFRARSGQELKAITHTLDQLEPVAQAPRRAFQIHPLHHWPLAAALLLSVGLAVQRHGLRRRPRDCS